MTDKFKPIMRREAEINLMSALRGAFNKDNAFPFQNCITCKRFVESEERCKFYNAKPPARVIAFGCHEYEDLDEIPF